MTTIVKKLSYDPDNILGRGNIGTVFSGFHRVKNKESFFRGAKYIPVAVKRIEKGRVDEFLIHLEVELMKTAGNHPNILRVIRMEMDDYFL